MIQAIALIILCLTKEGDDANILNAAIMVAYLAEKVWCHTYVFSVKEDIRTTIESTAKAEIIYSQNWLQKVAQNNHVVNLAVGFISSRKDAIDSRIKTAMNLIGYGVPYLKEDKEFSTSKIGSDVPEAIYKAFAPFLIALIRICFGYKVAEHLGINNT